MDKFMKVAIDEAYEGIRQKHGGPFGCAIVKDGAVVGKGHNRVLLKHDPTCHGEMEAIRDACKNLGSHSLAGCTLYTTAEPCPMCRGAILWANIGHVYYGCNIDDTDHIGFRDEDFYENWCKDDNDGFQEELDREECRKLFSDYVKSTNERY